MEELEAMQVEHHMQSDDIDHCDDVSIMLLSIKDTHLSGSRYLSTGGTTFGLRWLDSLSVASLEGG
jgi:hypothetical protein